MLRKSVTGLVVVLLVVAGLSATGSTVEEAGLSIQITKPQNGAQVVERALVEGTISNSKAQVQIIVHPVDHPKEFWVQPPVTVDSDGAWSDRVFIGSHAGKKYGGRQFQIMAIANPRRNLSEGRFEGAQWPKAEAQSQVVEVTRRK